MTAQDALGFAYIIPVILCLIVRAIWWIWWSEPHVEYWGATPEGDGAWFTATMFWPFIAGAAIIIGLGVCVCYPFHWAARSPNTTGFLAEIECGGNLYQYEYVPALKNNEWVTVAEVELKNGQFTVDSKLPTSTSSKDIWGVSTNQFTKVSMVTISPNHWGEKPVGNKHFFFILDKCKASSPPRGFFNEYLKESLTPHKRVFEALGSKMRVADSEAQLSGLGFSSTQSNSVVVQVTGKTKRVVKVIF